MSKVATCACGDFKVEVSGEPALNGICYCKNCKNCKKRTGSSFGMWAYFKRSSILNIEGNSFCYELTNPADVSHQKRFFVVAVAQPCIGKFQLKLVWLA